MSGMRAADLPVGSKVRNGSGDLVAVRRSRHTDGWWVSGLGCFQDHEIDEWLTERGHAQVLRFGPGDSR